jgi:hypothetical protein
MSGAANQEGVAMIGLQQAEEGQNNTKDGDDLDYEDEKDELPDHQV